MLKRIFLLCLIPLLFLSSCVKESPEPLYVPEKVDHKDRKSVRTTEIDGIGYEIFNDGTCEIISADPELYNGSNLELPDVFNDCEVVAIREGVFAGGSFTRVLFPRSLQSIGKGAFARCQLTQLVLPATLTELGEEAFSSCARLEKLTVEGSLETIPVGAFYGCRSLKEITLKEGVKTIEEEAFGDLPYVKNLSLPESLEVIGPFAFWRCGTDSLSISIPSGVKEIGKSAFDDSPWLENQSEEWILAGDGVLLRYNGTAEDLTLPEEVKYLSNAFDHAETVSLTLPAALLGISEGALEDSKIETVNYNGTDESILKELGK